MIFDYHKIAVTYLRGSFALDFISSAPLHLLILCFGNKASTLRAVRSDSGTAMHCNHLHNTKLTLLL